MSGRSAILPLLAVLLLSACMPATAVHDLEGRRIGQPDWQPITVGEARLSIEAPPAAILTREKIELPGRYLERWSVDAQEKIASLNPVYDGDCEELEWNRVPGPELV